MYGCRIEIQDGFPVWGNLEIISHDPACQERGKPLLKHHVKPLRRQLQYRTGRPQLVTQPRHDERQRGAISRVFASYRASIRMTKRLASL